jgi:hypothetical protein
VFFMKKRFVLVGASLSILAILAMIFLRGESRLGGAEMARFVPAETLVFLQADDLPLALGSLTATEAWNKLAPRYGIDKNYAKLNGFNRLLADWDFGSVDSVVFAKSQIAVAVLDFAAKSAADDAALKLKPTFAIVIETHSSRAADFVENTVADFARGQLGEIKIERRVAPDAAWTIFHSNTAERDIFAAVNGAIVVIGNSENAAQLCLDAKNNRRKSLADDENFLKMRAAAKSADNFAFGFVTTEGVRKLSNLGAILAAGQATEDPRAMSLLAQSLPPFLQKSIVSVGWAARLKNGAIEDCYFVRMPADLTARLREPLAAGKSFDADKFAALVPANARSLTVYNLQNPQAAWRGLLFAATTKLDAFSAAALSQTSGALLAPYGIAKADDFLSQTSGNLATARLDKENGTIALTEAKNFEQIKTALINGGDRASETANNLLILGTNENLQICRAAREQNKTLKTLPDWAKLNDSSAFLSDGFVRTLTRDDASAHDFVRLFAKKKNVPDAPESFWAITETRLMRDGFERRTTSPFGLIGALAVNFAEK